MPLLDTLIEAARPWAKFYSKSSATQAVVVFLHVAGMLGGGGLAIAADRAMWKARKASDDVQARLLAEVGTLHRAVLIGLTMTVVSGILMTASDLKTFAVSPIWWGKLFVFVLLLINGRWLQTIESRALQAPATIPAVWPRLALSSRFSYTLWFAVMLGGVLLKNA